MVMFSFLFKEKEEEYKTKIGELEKKIKDKEKEVSDLIVELEKANSKVSPKQFGVIERNIKDSKEKAEKYAKIISSFGLNPDKKYYRYKVEVSKFYIGVKFSEINKVLSENNIVFMEDLSELKFHSILKGLKNVDEAKKRFNDFENGKFDWDVAALVNRGDKLSKVFSSRKLLNIFSELSFEYMDDIAEFDFNTLKVYNFSYAQIDENNLKRDEYYKERRIEG